MKLFKLSLALFTIGLTAACSTTQSEQQVDSVVRVTVENTTSTARFLGTHKNQVMRELGQPTIRRKEGNEELWQYQGRACSLLMMIQNEKVAHTDIISYDLAATGSIGACVTDINRHRASASAVRKRNLTRVHDAADLRL